MQKNVLHAGSCIYILLIGKNKSSIVRVDSVIFLRSCTDKDY